MVHSQFVSVHGGHSGQFCHHAKDTLEEIVLKYIEYDYRWVGITEHIPGMRQEMLYPDQQEAGFTPQLLRDRFSLYMQECRRLQEKYAADIQLFAAMEIETYSGYETFIPELITEFRPDYIVGSVHFVNDMGFDYSREQYELTAATVGGYDALYCEYFDIQHEMIERLQPAVVGHFDLVRIFDEEYPSRLMKPEILQRVMRNLELIKELDLILDYNLRSLLKGAQEPYISKPILEKACEMEIAVAPGDDSHGLADIHVNMEQAIAALEKIGFNTAWQKPKTITYGT